MRRALEVYKEEFPEIEAILIGTRRTDPHGCKWFFSFLIYTTLLPHFPSLPNIPTYLYVLAVLFLLGFLFIYSHPTPFLFL